MCELRGEGNFGVDFFFLGLRGGEESGDFSTCRMSSSNASSNGMLSVVSSGGLPTGRGGIKSVPSYTRGGFVVSPEK